MNKNKSFVKEGAVGQNSADLGISFGDFLLSHRALPAADMMVAEGPAPDSLALNLPFVEDYLKFLELIVINERLLICMPPDLPIKKKLLASPGNRLLLQSEIYIGGKLRIFENTIRELEKRDIIIGVELPVDDLEMIECVKHYSHFLEQYDNRLDAARSLIMDYDEDEILREQMLQYLLIEKFGFPLWLADASQEWKTPFLLSGEETKVVCTLENLEKNLRSGVIELLKSKLDKGANSILKQIEALSNTTLFPFTPIATTIISNATTPSELLTVALQLRDDYRSFRRNMIELENDLFDENLTVERKMKIIREINAIAEEIWPENQKDLRQHTLEITDLIALIPTTIQNMTTSNIATIVNSILSKPVDLIFKALRRRKIRVMLKAKKDFLRSKMHQEMLTALFKETEMEQGQSIEYLGTGRPVFRCFFDKIFTGVECPNLTDLTPPPINIDDVQNLKVILPEEIN